MALSCSVAATACDSEGPDATKDSGVENDSSVDPDADTDPDGGPQTPVLPEYVSFTGEQCGFVSSRNQMFPVCKVNADEDGVTFDVDCSKHAGSLQFIEGALRDPAGFTLAADDFAVSGRWGQNVSCSSTRRIDRSQVLSCSTTMAGQQGTEGDKSASCVFNPVESFKPEAGCLALPSTFDSFVVGGEDHGACRVAQDACAFRADCEDGSFTTGLVGKSSISSFAVSVPAPTPELPDRTTIANCVADADASGFSGTCGEATLTIAVSEQSPVCAPLAPNDTHFFALASCDLLEEDIGQPSCVYRQNNCTWDVHCTTDTGAKHVFGGTLAPGDTSVSFALATGTPCEASFEGGRIVGRCTVPGEIPCAFNELVSPTPGRAPSGSNPGCGAILEGQAQVELGDFGFNTHGCGPVSANCPVGFQHRCSFVSVCDFGVFEQSVLSGTVSSASRSIQIHGEDSPFTAQVPTLAFNGYEGYACEVQKVHDDEIGTPATAWREGNAGHEIDRATLREADEWYGFCENTAIPHICRGTNSPNSGTPEYKGLRLFFGDRACGLAYGSRDQTTGIRAVVGSSDLGDSACDWPVEP